MNGERRVAIIARVKPGLVGVAFTHAHDTRVIFVQLENLTPFLLLAITARWLALVLDAALLLVIVPPSDDMTPAQVSILFRSKWHTAHQCTDSCQILL